MIRWIERVLLLAGAMALAATYEVWKETAFHQVRAQGQLQEMLAARTPPRAAVADALAPPAGSDPVIGYLRVPRLAFLAPVLEGVDDRTLALAAGHLPETPLPWQDGNSAVAGHRDTFFRALRALRVGDELELLTARGDFRYRVLRTVVVAPDDVWVLGPWEGVRLSLVTCYPFAPFGRAPRRFVVHAALAGSR